MGNKKKESSRKIQKAEKNKANHLFPEEEAGYEEGERKSRASSIPSTNRCGIYLIVSHTFWVSISIPTVGISRPHAISTWG